VAWGDNVFSGFHAPLSGLAGNRYLEGVERRGWLDLWRAPVLDAVEEGGIEARWFGPIQATIVAGLPEAPLLNLILGAAENGAVKDGHLEAVIEWAESHGIDCRIPVATDAPEAGAAEDFLNRRGYRRSQRLVRFVRDASPPRFPDPPGIEVDEVPEFTEGFSEYLSEGFGLALVAGAFFDCLPERDRWRSYVAIGEHGYGIGAATMMVDFGVAMLGFAATSPQERGKGGHLALLRRCIRDAGATGCQVVFTDVEEPIAEPVGESPAARNLGRAGFIGAAVRPIWRPA
jgi:GNAT superfamily N-acetyltransferase